MLMPDMCRGAESTDSLLIKLTGQNTAVRTVKVQDFKQFDIRQVRTDESGWSGEIGFNELKKHNLLILRINVDKDSIVRHPAILFSGRFSHLCIYQDTLLLYDNHKASGSENLFETRILPLDLGLPKIVYLVCGYRNIWDLPTIEYFRIGEGYSVASGLIPFPPDMRNWLVQIILGLVLLSGGFFFLPVTCFFHDRSRKMLVYLALFAIFSGTPSLILLFQYFIDLPPFRFTVLLLIVSNLAPWAFIGFLKYAVETSFRLFLNITYWLSLAWSLSFPVLSQYLPIQPLYWGGLGLNMVLVVGIIIKERIYQIRDFRPPLIGYTILSVLLVIDSLHDFRVISFTVNVDWGVLALILGLVIFITRDVAKSKKQMNEYEQELNRNKMKMLALENQNIQSQYEALKNQINPHFLFNSLNTLASLIQMDRSKASVFVEEFSTLYRNILDMNNRALIGLGKELGLLDSYIYLQKMRIGKHLTFIFAIREEDRECLLPPLSLQLLVENVIKHNEISEECPVSIQISSNGQSVEVRNQLHPKFIVNKREGIGLQNLRSRYLHICSIEPVFTKTETEFIARIPIIECT